MNKISEIKKVLLMYLSCDDVNDAIIPLHLVDTIHDLFVCNKLSDVENTEAIVFFYYGLYYLFKRDKIAIKYFLKAIDLDCDLSMNALGIYYKDIEKDNEKAEYYLKMSANRGNVNAMNNLGNYYFTINDHVNAKYYYKCV